MIIQHRFATTEDIPFLARMNRALVEDEGHRNRVQSDAWLEQRMRAFLAGDYRTVLFEAEGKPAGYALHTIHREHPDTVHLRKIFVERGMRRRGVGSEMMRILREEIWPADKRIAVGVLSGNRAAIAFYESIGFTPYAIEMEIPARKIPGNTGK
ncbi:MAG: GNAT family N-acetyltransferase [Anaerolineales bacterium]|nr:GNAT family N-acetyltransferase [Anaerolineales bacterium]